MTRWAISDQSATQQIERPPSGGPSTFWLIAVKIFWIVRRAYFAPISTKCGWRSAWVSLGFFTTSLAIRNHCLCKPRSRLTREYSAAALGCRSATENAYRSRGG